MSSRIVCLSVLFLSLKLGHLVVAQEQRVSFNQVVNLNGDMQLNTVILPDNTKIETFSQSQRQLLVNQNPNPLPASHVIGSTGQPFVQLAQQSVTIETNGATDLVGGQIELPLDQNMLSSQGVSADNAFVAQLTQDRQAWMIIEPIKAVNSTDQTVRMIKLNQIDGEYMAIGRKTVETSNVLTPFGSGSQSTVQITGSGIQELEFTDGFRMSVKSSQPMTVATDVRNGLSSSMLNGAQSPNNFRYLVTTNLAGVTANLNQMAAVVQLPLNPTRLQQMATQMGAGPNDSISLGISQRGVLQNPGGATGNLSPQQKREAGLLEDISDAISDSSSDSSSSDSESAASSADSSEASSVDSGSAASATDAGTAATDAGTAGTSTSASSGDTATSTTTTSSSQSGSSNNQANAASTTTTSATSTTTTTSSSSSSSSTTDSGSSSNGDPVASQLLLSPTFTPVAGNVVFDPINVRVAAPVTALDGEFIITMAMAQGQSGTLNPSPSQPSIGAQPTSTNSSLTLDSQSGAPLKRQSTAASGQNVIISMAQINALVQQAQMGGYLPIGAMMAELGQTSQSAAAPAPLAPTRRTRRSRHRMALPLKN